MKIKVKSVVFAVLTLSVLLSAAFLDIPVDVNFASFTMAHKESERISLCPGGMTFGVKYFTKGALVVGVTDIETSQGLISPSRNAGLEVKDIITGISGKKIKSAEDFKKSITESNGSVIEIEFIRNGSAKKASVNPVIDKNENVYKIGLWVRDSTAGIGTITFVNKETGEFGGLGHGICDSETGVLLPLERGVIVDVEITDIIIGKKNAPGELKGMFDKFRKGELSKNSEVGVFGKYDELPDRLAEPVPIGFIGELKTGRAYILTALNSKEPQQYEIEIEKIYSDKKNTKNFLIKITDEDLLSKTGGIIQGMSGSPILQDGKLVGAVTHVLVDNSSKGYGIHIENMIDGNQE